MKSLGKRTSPAEQSRNSIAFRLVGLVMYDVWCVNDVRTLSSSTSPSRDRRRSDPVATELTRTRKDEKGGQAHLLVCNGGRSAAQRIGGWTPSVSSTADDRKGTGVFSWIAGEERGLAAVMTPVPFSVPEAKGKLPYVTWEELGTHQGRCGTVSGTVCLVTRLQEGKTMNGNDLRVACPPIPRKHLAAN